MELKVKGMSKNTPEKSNYRNTAKGLTIKQRYKKESFINSILCQLNTTKQRFYSGAIVELKNFCNESK